MRIIAMVTTEETIDACERAAEAASNNGCDELAEVLHSAVKNLNGLKQS